MNKKTQITRIIANLEQNIKSQPGATAYKTGYIQALNRLKQDVKKTGEESK